MSFPRRPPHWLSKLFGQVGCLEADRVANAKYGIALRPRRSVPDRKRHPQPGRRTIRGMSSAFADHPVRADQLQQERGCSRVSANLSRMEVHLSPPTQWAGPNPAETDYRSLERRDTLDQPSSTLRGYEPYFPCQR